MAAHKSSTLTKRVLNAIGMLGSAQAVNIICSVVRNKLIALWLGPAGVGLNSILVNGSNLVTTATQFDLRNSALRDIAAAQTIDIQALKCAIVRRWALIIGLAGAIIMVVASPLLSITAFGGSLSHSFTFASLAPFVFFSAYSAGEFAIMQGCDRLKLLAKSNLAAGLIALAASVPLLYIFRLGAIVAVINIYAFSLALCTFSRRVKTPKIGQKLKWSLLWSHGRSFLTLGLSISASMLLTNLMQYIFAAYINTTGGEDSLGIYQSGFTLVNSYVGIIFTAVGLEYYPRLTRLINRQSMVRTVITHEIGLIVRLITPLAIIFVCASDLIVHILYSRQFDAVLPFVSYAIIGAIFRGVSLCFAYRILAAGDSKAYIFTEATSVTAGLILNICAFQYWSYTGLGISYIVWYAFYAMLTAAVCRYRYGVRTPSKQLLYITTAAVLTLVAIWMKQLAGWWLPAVAILTWLLPVTFCKILRRH